MLEHVNDQPQNPSRVVILGAKGFVGAACASELGKAGIDVLLLGHQDLDLLDANAGAELAGLLRPEDALVVISARAPVKDNAMLESNICMMSSVCEALGEVTPAYVMYVSSDAVYADSSEPMNEAFCAEPNSLHGVMHLTREVMLENAYAGPLGIIRPTLIYGASDPHNGYGPNRFRRLAAAGEEIVLFGEGEERRDHVSVDDVAGLIVRMLMHRSRGKLNAATGTVTSFAEIAQMVVSYFDQPVAVKGSARVGKMPHNGYRAFDPAQTHAAFPDFSYTGLAEGLAKAHRDRVEKPDG